MAQRIRWMFADAGKYMLGLAIAKKDPLRWSQLLLPGELADDLENHVKNYPKDNGRPILARVEGQGDSSEKTFQTPTEAMHWLRTDANALVASIQTEQWKTLDLRAGKESFDGPCKVLSDFCSVGEAKRQLDAGVIPNDSDFFVVFSKNATCWFLLYRSPHTEADVQRMIKKSKGSKSNVSDQVFHPPSRHEVDDKKLQDIFDRVAKLEGAGKVLKLEDLHDVHQKVLEIVTSSTKLEEEMLHDVFWRYCVNETATLGENEAMSFLRGVVMRCRDAARPEAQRELEVPFKQVHDEYVLGRRLGNGAFGVASLATQKRTNRDVVLKSQAKGNPQMPMEEISSEFTMMTTLKHPKIARYYEIFQDGTNVYTVSEPYYGGDLSELITRASDNGVTVDESWLARIVKQIAQGMSYLHGSGIIHCDLKQDNVMVSNEKDLSAPQVVVIDFGLAGSFHSPKQGGGTPGYIPPEVWTKHLWTPRGDVFSLGCLVFSMVTYENPFVLDATTLDDVEYKTLHTEPTLDWGSLDLREMVSSMLTKDFKKRPTMDLVLQCPWIVNMGADVDDDKVGAVVLETFANEIRQTPLRKALLLEFASKENLAQLTELNKLFLKMDTNNDGRLSVKEIREGLTSLNWTQEEMQKFMNRLLESDADDAEVPYEEFMVNLMVTLTGDEENVLLQHIFREIDITNKGSLDIRDIEELLKRDRVKEALGSRDAATLLKWIDSNGDGFVTFEDFKAVLCGTPQLPSTIGERNVVLGSILRTYRPVRKSFANVYSKGDPVEFYSTTHKRWLPATILEVNPAKGIVVSLRPGYWLTAQEVSDRIKPAT